MAESNVAAAPKETQQSAKPTRKGSLLSRVAYSFGNVGQSAFYNALSTYFIVYVTSSLFSGVDKALATKLIGVITGLVVVIRIAEIFIDPLLGNIIDNTKTKWGRFKPWQLIGGTVSAVLLVLVYTGLFGLVNVNTTLFIVLFVITFIVLDVFYSLRDISYWGMIPALSSDSHERSTYTALGSFGGSIGYNGLTIVVIPIVTYFSYVFTGKHQESQSGWTCFAIIVAILGVLTVCSVAFGTKESTSTLRAKAEDNGGPLAAFKALAQNDQLLWVALSYLLFIVGTNNLAVVTVGLVFFYLPQTFIQMTAILSLTDSIEYGQLKNGKRNEAVTLSVRPMLDKIAGACSNGIVGAVAIAAGMIGSATAADMTAANIHTFKVWAFYVPLAVIILSGVVFLLKVKITEKMHADIVKQLEEQLNEG